MSFKTVFIAGLAGLLTGLPAGTASAQDAQAGNPAGQAYLLEMGDSISAMSCQMRIGESLDLRLNCAGAGEGPVEQGQGYDGDGQITIRDGAVEIDFHAEEYNVFSNGCDSWPEMELHETVMEACFIDRAYWGQMSIRRTR